MVVVNFQGAGGETFQGGGSSSSTASGPRSLTEVERGIVQTMLDWVESPQSVGWDFSLFEPLWEPSFPQRIDLVIGEWYATLRQRGYTPYELAQLAWVFTAGMSLETTWLRQMSVLAVLRRALALSQVQAAAKDLVVSVPFVTDADSRFEPVTEAHSLGWVVLHMKHHVTGGGGPGYRPVARFYRTDIQDTDVLIGGTSPSGDLFYRGVDPLLTPGLADGEVLHPDLPIRSQWFPRRGFLRPSIAVDDRSETWALISAAMAMIAAVEVESIEASIEANDREVQRLLGLELELETREKELESQYAAIQEEGRAPSKAEAKALSREGRAIERLRQELNEALEALSETDESVTSHRWAYVGYCGGVKPSEVYAQQDGEAVDDPLIAWSGIYPVGSSRVSLESLPPEMWGEDEWRGPYVLPFVGRVEPLVQNLRREYRRKFTGTKVDFAFVSKAGWARAVEPKSKGGTGKRSRTHKPHREQQDAVVRRFLMEGEDDPEGREYERRMGQG